VDGKALRLEILPGQLEIVAGGHEDRR